MKKFRLFYLCILALFAAFFFYSCVTESGIQFPEQTNEDANILHSQNAANSTNFSNSQLLIVPIPFYDNMFHFPDEERFQSVKEEIAEKSEEYKDYFIWRDLNFSSFDQITKITNEVTDTMTEAQINLLLTQYNVVPNAENEVDFKFNMLYKNLLLNLDGFVSIGQNLVAFTNEDMSYYSSKEHYDLCKKGKSLPLKIHYFGNKNDSSRFPESKCSGNCRQTFDPSWSCSPRRLRGTVEIELAAYNSSGNTPGFPGQSCAVIYECEVETTWLKRIGYIWWAHKANRVDVSIDWGIWNQRGGTRFECVDGLISRFLLNKSSVSIFRTITCESNLNSGRESCASGYDYSSYGILKGIGGHSGTENGNCGGFRSCSSNCI